MGEAVGGLMLSFGLPIKKLHQMGKKQNISLFQQCDIYKWESYNKLK